MRNTRDTKLLFELSEKGRRSHRLPPCDVPERPAAELLPASALAAAPPALPELSEPQVVRHFANLSQLNMSVDTHFYPLGSCTMKYNPKRNERCCRMPGFGDVHPYQPESTLQGMLQLLYEMQEYLQEISGLPACSLQPAAGAHGELTALWVAAAYFRDRGEKRTKVLVPDSAHGTNPASATMAGFTTVTVKTLPTGGVDMDDLHRHLDDEIAVFMITNPNTVGIFEPNMRDDCRRRPRPRRPRVPRRREHERDPRHRPPRRFRRRYAALQPPQNLQRPPRRRRPRRRPDLRDRSARTVLANAGGGEVERQSQRRESETKSSPTPTLDLDSRLFCLDYNRPKSIGRVRAFFGNTGVLVRAYCYIRTHGPDGLRRVSENAVLNANYLLSKVKHFLPVPQGDRCMHEFVASAAKLKGEKGVSAMDVAKRLLDYGFHAPTVYFPLSVKESIMVEPTETESKETLDAFAETLFHVIGEDADLLHEAPHSTAISRPDDVRAARQPVLVYRDHID